MSNKQTIIYQTRSDQSFLKQINIKKILNLLWEHGELSRIELAEYSRLNKKTITNIANELLENQIIKPCGYKKSDAGRRQQLLEINAERSYHIGLDLGPTHIYCLIVDFKGKVITEENVELRINMEPELIIKMIINLLHSVIKQSGLDFSSISSLGFGVPGFINRETSVSISSENIPGWNNIPLKEIMQKEVDVPFYIEDSSRTMALAEHWFGAGRNINDYIVFDLGYGIGCGIFIDGNLYMGSNFKSGEIGHTIVKPNGPKCICGHRGCIESVASGKAIADIAIEQLKNNSDSTLMKLCNGDIEKITARDVIIASDLGDKLSIQILKEAGQYIAIGVINALHFFNPQTIVLSGRLILSGNVLFDTITEFIKENSMKEIYDDVKIARSNMGPRSSALGAALLHLQEFFSLY